MPRITPEIKAFIVTRNACFDKPTQVRDAVKEMYGMELPLQQIEGHDPTKVTGRNLAKKWRALFDATREQFIKDTSATPAAHKAWRVARLYQLHDQAADRGNVVLAAQLLEQIAKEMGDAYTNRRRHDHRSSDGSMTPKAPAPVPLDTSQLSTATLRELMQARASAGAE